MNPNNQRYPSEAAFFGKYPTTFAVTFTDMLGIFIYRNFAGTTNPVADINGDGTVNITDLSTLLNKYE